MPDNRGSNDDMNQSDQHDHVDELDEIEDEDSEANLVLALAVEPEDLTLDELFGVSDEQVVEVVVRTLARVQVEEAVEISVLVTNDENLRTLNREYRDLDNSTDVLSFPAQDDPLVSAPADELWQHSPDDDFDDEEYAGGANGATPSVQNAGMALDADAEHIDDALDESNETFEDFDEDFDEMEESALDLGDIAISYEAVKRQAASAGHSAGWEFCYLLVHGVLHLVGYDDQTDAGFSAMVKLQDAILGETNIAK